MNPARTQNLNTAKLRLKTVTNKLIWRKKFKKVHLVAYEYAKGSTVFPLKLFKGRQMKQEWTNSLLPQGSMPLMRPKDIMSFGFNILQSTKLPDPIFFFMQAAK